MPLKVQMIVTQAVAECASKRKSWLVKCSRLEMLLMNPDSHHPLQLAFDLCEPAAISVFSQKQNLYSSFLCLETGRTSYVVWIRKSSVFSQMSCLQEDFPFAFVFMYWRMITWIKTEPHSLMQGRSQEIVFHRDVCTLQLPVLREQANE